ncbi:SRPBCC family protein [Amphiplicatus metriothermophilus]|uniref:Uncharacterized conserved protein YndB, AHSA1/START domain n=1 Tax=Amphiplicatus metriothermophilus TaxID=1519374 RepID=A0A239PQT5_9PROT|nr:SRPBCC family protein [Amphiplicatus metriothermophilus]MBB5518575.1 uncharacterized protein YndB with AHSA1/START domain [Amphiplicatus metriothermophilus]SNT72266.1 Uncharacterized conserved protein YndB, AHSA1/START domain [Amphiplicatus metriothermophilus]
MSDYGEYLDKTTFRIERLLPGPLERVWAYLTEADKRAEWFCAGEFDLRPGGRAEFHFDHRRITSADDKPPPKYEKHAGETRFDGRIVKAEPPHLLVFEWPEESGDWTEVEIRLTEESGKVRLTLTHSKLRTPQDLISISGGWHSHLDILKAKLEGATPPPFWAAIARLEPEYEKKLLA